MRVCAYCRVSTEQDDQRNSLRNQKGYFERYISGQPGWELVRVFADEGISGTSTKKRVAFQEMIAACERGEIDLILTKEVSRFARNTVDTLSYTRRLKEFGVGVIFIGDNIDTRQGDGEFRLSIMASVAQEESRKTSERVRWGQLRSMERGVVFGNDSIFGFDLRNGVLRVNEREAAVVRMVFDKFLNGASARQIARELDMAGIRPPKAEEWSGTMILRMLRNEKYAGDLLQKKYVTVDYLTHRKVENDGREEQIYLRDHHEPVINREVWNRAQQELERRGSAMAKKTRYSSRYWCSGKLRCGACGALFVPRRAHRTDGTIRLSWGCGSRLSNGGCEMHMVNSRVLETCARHALAECDMDFDGVIRNLVAALLRSAGDRAGQENRKKAVLGKMERALDAWLGGEIEREAYAAIKEKYETELSAISEEESQERMDETEIRSYLQQVLKSSDLIFRALVQEVVVNENSLTIHLSELPQSFELSYHTKGYKNNFKTIIERCEII